MHCDDVGDDEGESEKKRALALNFFEFTAYICLQRYPTDFGSLTQ